MPIYEYSCGGCRHQFEEIVLSKKEQVTCPECGSRKVEKQLSVFSSPAAQCEKNLSTGGCACTPQTCGCH